MDWNYEGLSKASIDDPILNAFPRNPNQCVNKYQKLCPFHSYCLAWANPLKHCSEPPMGFEVKHWNPAKDEEKPPPREVFEEGKFEKPVDSAHTKQEVLDKVNITKGGSR